MTITTAFCDRQCSCWNCSPKQGQDPGPHPAFPAPPASSSPGSELSGMSGFQLRRASSPFPRGLGVYNPSQKKYPNAFQGKKKLKFHRTCGIQSGDHSGGHKNGGSNNEGFGLLRGGFANLGIETQDFNFGGIWSTGPNHQN